MYGFQTKSEIIDHKKSLAIGYKNRLKMWTDKLDQYARKHKITRKQALSIIFDDHSGVTMRDLLSFVESHKFASDIMGK